MLKALLMLATPALLFSAIIPTAPSKLQLSPNMYSVQLSWTDNANNETGYKVFRDGFLIASLPTDSEHYHDTHLDKETEYHYIVKATAQEDWMSNVTIAEVLVANTKHLDPTYQQSGSWIKLYNHNDSAFDVGDYYLSNDSANPTKWRIHEHTIIPAHGYLTIWADKANSDFDNHVYHTNYKLKTSGGSLLFSHKYGELIQRIDYPEQKEDISFLPTDDQILYSTPALNKENSSFIPTLARSKKVSFSLKSGFYDGAQTLSLSQKNGAAIYYTTDGATPTKDAMLYSQPIMIDKTMVVRAIALQDAKFASKSISHTYLIDEDTTLPVMSLAIDTSSLYDSHTGIFTNYRKKYRRAANIEYIKNGISQFSENIGVRVHGGTTRGYAQKSLAIYAKDKYGPKSIKYKLFPDKPQIKKVKSFILRNSGNDWGYTMMKDGMVQSIVKDTMDIDYQSYQAAILFINGKYWGIYNIREKVNEDYFAANHGVDDKNIDLIEGKDEVHAGDMSDYNTLLSYMHDHDLVDEASYQHIAEQIDVDEYINYMITEIYGGNDDWPYQNIKYWKEKRAGAKWRWALYDLDYTFSDYWIAGYSFNWALAEDSDESENPPWSTFFFRSLMKNTGFKNRFLSHFNTHLNTTFKPQRINHIITTLKNNIQAEMPRHFAKWPAKGDKTWQEHIDSLREFANKRGEIIRDDMQSIFGVSGDITLTLDTPTQGSIKVDGVPVIDAHTGHYFHGANVTLQALPQAGYRFDAWVYADGHTDSRATIQVPLIQNAYLQARFVSIPTPLPKVAITEFNYKSASNHDSGDWIELYNYSNSPINLSGWTLSDDSLSKVYTIANGTVLEADTYLVFVQDSIKFSASFPSVSTFQGNFAFGLGKTNDSIRLFDNNNRIVDQVDYDQNFPNASGNGKTLSLINLSTNHNNKDNWELKTNYGTPGAF